MMFNSVAPILPVRDLSGALDRYSRMGFRTSPYEGPDEYGFADRDDVSFHLAQSTFHDPKTSSVMVYLYVSDADALHQEWTTAGIAGRHHAPSDTPYGLREGAYVDPDGNLLRYGSWLPGHHPSTQTADS
ncbi:bleomycin resistance protein [Angustibacter sp. McL0619]|uniref:bleomycin resistance protein n=1 Tax=Angustibacter sp. McL0619 TaxID=3415676 RepID=UPI003CF520D6